MGILNTSSRDLWLYRNSSKMSPQSVALEIKLMRLNAIRYYYIIIAKMFNQNFRFSILVCVKSLREDGCCLSLSNILLSQIYVRQIIKTFG